MARKKKGKKNGGNRSKKQNNGKSVVAQSPVDGSPSKEAAEVTKEEEKKQVQVLETPQVAAKESTTDAVQPPDCNGISAGKSDLSNDKSEDTVEVEKNQPGKSEGAVKIEEKPAGVAEVEDEAKADVAMATSSEAADTALAMEDETNEKVDASAVEIPKAQEELLSQMQETRETVEEISNDGLKEATSSENLDNSFEADSDAPTRFVDLETAYSWFADHVQNPTPPEVEIVFQDEDATTLGDEDLKETTTLDSNAEIDTNNDNDILEEPKPLVKRNSLVGRVKTVNADGDTDEEDGPVVTQAEIEEEDPWVIPDSNLRNPNRRICVVTTAGLPWFTGTAVNPLLRALYLTRGRPKHYVTLVIPWCHEEDDRNKTLGKNHSLANQAEQEEWIRDFCRTRANCEEEEKNLKIIFYPSNYNEAMGSIFPAVDICELIPDEEADIAILEEPEHLNWLRVPTPYKESEEEKKQEPHSATKKTLKGKRPATAKEKQELGWRFKFRHVVGIIHTNYKAYAEQYGIGVKFITAPALCALNALVVRAYCHKVILLSGTLPSLTPYKEITCNVHGVRGEFLERPTNAVVDVSKGDDEPHAPVYFIGKLIWAKGFDKILEVENMYREKHDDYFPIDVYGAGGDEMAIKRAFYGRIPQIQQGDSSSSDEKAASEPEVADVFTWETSLRSHLVENSPFRESEKRASLDEYMAKRRISTIDPDDDDAAAPEIKEPPKTPKKHGNFFEELADNVVPLSVLGNLTVSTLDTTKATGGAAVEVVKNVVGAGLNVAFTTDFGSPQRTPRRSGSEPASPDKKRKSKLIFEPPQSIFEFRRNPIKARFLGTKDHVLLRDIAEHKIFLNMSITEVLCTTSAEAMAMGKFVILPKHPSNTFFLQFPNCLAYTSLEDCVEKLEWALANDPVPLSEECAKKLSWEGANERLFDSAAVTRDEWEEWAETGKLKSDTDAARFHVETGMKGQLIGNFFTGDKSKDKSQMKS